MALCKECGKKVSWLDGGSDICNSCHNANFNSKQAEGLSVTKAQDIWKSAAHKEADKANEQLSAQINSIALTTETAPDLKITKRIEIVTAECAFGMNIFKDLFAGVRDIVGGRSEAVQKTMRDSRKTVLYELKKEAYEVGANAVVGVDLDYVELSSAGSMVMLVASGTAVVIED